MKDQDKPSYNVNLPKTSFPMKANSAVREVEIQKIWEEKQVYARNLQKRKGNAKYVLHDGPPYLSSDKIHIGTALNKILKDIVTKYKALKGHYAPYVPGYDSHGLPIENAVLKDVKGGRSAMTPVELRKKCRQFALSNLKGQEDNFKRLGVWGDWEHPYITLDQHFEAKQLRVFGKMAAAGYLYKGLKPVQWCPNCETALAEAEVEYADHISHSIYVKFRVISGSLDRLPDFAKSNQNVSFVIWTTTPWTLPANLAVALNADFDYDFYRLEETGEVLVFADALKAAFLREAELDESKMTLLGSIKGKMLENLETRHPFMDRTSRVILGDHVTAEAGTGCVHTAPGHGPEDFIIGKKYDLGVLSPVDGRGIFTTDGGPFVGQRYDKATPLVVDLLAEKQVLIKHLKFSHSYPHCWRCKKPLIFRATEQWFASVDGFRQKALEAIDNVQWLPASGRNRIFKMVENRADWCISRQRAWGVPIPVFYCKKCNEPLLTEESVEKVAKVFDANGSDSWWELPVSEFIGGSKCAKCGHDDFEREQDIMDVWFDSGSTHAAVLDARPELGGTPCELYLEGSDQHRGWFQSSLLTSVATNGHAPYKSVLTHGFVVDENGRKMSKSLGNVVVPGDVIKEYGADVLRLWVASVNYTDDIPIGKNMLKQLADVYRKLRNTARFMLGNLYDFDPARDMVAIDQLQPIDRFILHRLNLLVEQVTQDFDRFEFFKYYQLLQNFCGVELSSFYFDILKDRLYTQAASSPSRRAAQTVLVHLLHALTRLLTPVTPHMAEDIWQHLPAPLARFYGDLDSVLLADYPIVEKDFDLGDKARLFDEMKLVRDTVYKALESARAQGKIGSSLEARVDLTIQNADLAAMVSGMGDDLPSFFITSQASVTNEQSHKPQEILATLKENGTEVIVSRAHGEKCQRCWKYLDSVGADPAFSAICAPCAQIEAALVV